MHTLKNHIIYAWEDFENRYSIENAPEWSTIIAKILKWTDVEYEKELKKEDGNIFCLEIGKDMTETFDVWEYTLRLFLEGKKTKAIAEGTLTIQ